MSRPALTDLSKAPAPCWMSSALQLPHIPTSLTLTHCGEGFYYWISIPQQTGMKFVSFIGTEIKYTLFFFLKMLACVMALLLSRVEEGPVQSRPNKRVLKKELTREFSRTEKFSTHNSLSEKSDDKFCLYLQIWLNYVPRPSRPHCHGPFKHNTD